MSLQIATTIIVKYYNITKYEKKSLYQTIYVMCTMYNWVGIADDVIVWCRTHKAQYIFFICEKGTENTRKTTDLTLRRL